MITESFNFIDHFEISNCDHACNIDRFPFLEWEITESLLESMSDILRTGNINSNYEVFNTLPKKRRHS